jgi:hypothetical protein
MTPSFEFILICIGLHYLKRWTAGKVMHHPERQTMDALDRMLQWVFVVAAVWLCVGCASHCLIYAQLVSEITADLETGSLP